MQNILQLTPALRPINDQVMIALTVAIVSVKAFINARNA